MIKILGGLSWIDWPQNPSRLCLLVPFSSFVDLVVVVRFLRVFTPVAIMVACCRLATVARTVLEISGSQLGLRAICWFSMG